ncbi:hypothetical protein [Celerinatantimonas diazotrophica]|uniref:Uncharacterized protein n=1 Tax=Celerinatantimonas diazotrophica TaxID=412034 RepID=A0A4R1K570_9GAMM|nr:hypothetical protein [Celerinatantimonas diazotrophica]TCK58893.1 hypothetical protein EV690_1048 [Celerinatantimonas diazotrophica]CAG9297525.1 hypothetical protein CEDIAZO_02712 [Celerinatantimonas diazotrophica]
MPANHLDPSLNFDFGTSGCPASDAIKARSLAINDYLAQMKVIENDNKATENTAIMITKFRKIYYDSHGWNHELIRGTEDIPPFATSKATQALKRSHEVLTNNKQDAYDFAHLFAIMDASNHNGPLTPLPEKVLESTTLLAKFLKQIAPTVDDRLMAAGWLGDLSEIVGNFYINDYKKENKTKQQIIDQFGAGYKTIANVDGQTIVNHYQLSDKQSEPVSQILSDYFSNVKPSLNPYKIFASTIGLKFGGTEFTNAASWLTKQEKNLRTCTAFYLFESLGFQFDFDQKLLDTLMHDVEDALNNLDIRPQEETALKEIRARLHVSDESKVFDKDLMIITICTLIWLGFYNHLLAITPLLSAYLSGLQTAISYADAKLKA